MTRRACPWLLAIFAVAMVSCRPGQNAQRGGDLEHQLVAATVAVDLAKVKQLLATGANPNKLAPHEGHDQSPWKLALHQAKSTRPDTIEIVRAMLTSGANPAVAWGEGPSRRGGYTDLPETPILEAIATPEIARALLEAGLDPRECGLALELAVEQRLADVVHVLVEAGVDVNTRATAITPLVAAIETRNVALMTYLEEHGAREKP